MISINGTLILQIVHFLIFWFILDFFLLKKFVVFVQNQEKEFVNLTSAIEHERALLQESYAKKSAHWNHYQSLLLKHTPYLIEPYKPTFTIVLCPVFNELSKNKKEEIVKDVSAIIAQKVLHA